MKDFRKLLVWDKAHQLTLAIYHVTATLPREETYGLVSQMRRAASSIPSNIAEGCGRDGDAELSRFCVMARGSASELEYQLLLSRDLKLIQSQEYEQLTQQTVEIKRMLTVLVQKLSRNLWFQEGKEFGGERCFCGFFVDAGDERLAIWSRSNTRPLCEAPYGSRACCDYCASAMGTNLNPLARALDCKLDSSQSMRFCS